MLGVQFFGELGIGNTATKGDAPAEMGDSLLTVNLGTGKTALAISAGVSHTCAILNDNSLRCWGLNAQGQLGLGDISHRGDNAGEMGDSLPPVDLGTGRTAIAVAAGRAHTCALLDDNTVKCWGDNAYGQLGMGDANNRGDDTGEMGDSLQRVDLGTGKSAVAIALGKDHSCAILNDNSVKCWGFNNNGQLGIGVASNRGSMPGQMGDNLPVINLGTGKTAIALAAGFDHNCVILNDNSIKCWGSNSYGVLGLGNTLNKGDDPGEMGDSLSTVDIGLGKTAISLSAGASHSCALLNDHRLRCWGYNAYGQLGLADTSNRGDNVDEMGNSLPIVDLGIGFE